MALKTILIDENNQTKIIDSSNNYEDRVKNLLSAEDFVLYQNAFNLNAQLAESYRQQNLFTEESVYEAVFIPELNENIDVEIGVKRVLAPGVQLSQLQLHPEFAAWLARLPIDLFD